jgi:hypothetical protein
MEQRQHCAASLGTDLGSNFGGKLAEKSALPHDLWRIAHEKTLVKTGLQSNRNNVDSAFSNTSCALSDNLTP